MQTTTYSAVLGHLISALRQQKGLQQPALAEALGISQASYSRLESGKAMWTFDQLITASQALDIPVEEIYKIFENKVQELRNGAKINVRPAGRANSTGGETQDSPVGKLLAGAALGALLATLINR